MIELNMSIYTNRQGENKVTLTAAFATHADAVLFHDGLAQLCREHSPPAEGTTQRASWPARLLIGGKS